MANKLVGGVLVTLLAVSFGTGYGWTCRGATECQPSSLLTIDTTLQSDVQLLQVIAGPNASRSTTFPPVVFGINIAQTPYAANLQEVRDEAASQLTTMKAITNQEILNFGYTATALIVLSSADIATAGDGSSVVYVYLKVIQFDGLIPRDQGLQDALVHAYQSMAGWSKGMAVSVTMGDTTLEATNQNALAVGDPHLQNMLGERFDLMQPGKHVLVQIPRRESLQNTLLRVQAVAQPIGGLCADTYFTRINVTGKWPNALRPGGFIFRADDPDSGAAPKWMDLHAGLQVKVVHGKTKQGIRYLNFYVKHLDRAGLPVGGLLGEDDHEEASTPSRACEQRMSLIAGATP